ncbi:cytochrome P450 [Poronia punctata]|nr:cytochrome P450 [Poronia punctata]
MDQQYILLIPFLFLLLLLLSLLIIIPFFTSWYRLRHIPGPRLGSWSYLWLARGVWLGTQYDSYKTLHDTYGGSPLIRLGPNELTTDDPEIARRMGSAKGAYSRARWYDAMRLNVDHAAMFNLLDPHTHDRLKAKLAPGYSGRETPGLEDIVDQQLADLVELIRKKYVTTKENFRPLDLARVIPLFTLDVISRIALGREFGCVQADTDVYGFYHNTEVPLPALCVVAEVPWLRKVVNSRLGLRLFGPKETDKVGIGKLMGLANERVRQRWASDTKDQKDMLGSWMRHGITQKECETEALLLFVAGSETTSVAMRLTLLYIISTPRVYHNLRDEMRAAIGKGKVSSPITSAEARELPYLQAVIYEGLRIRPVTTHPFPKEVPPGGDTIHGHFVPGGTAISTNISALLRSKALFGLDADVFRPERFLEADEAARAEMQRNVELNFGYGRWMCAGKPIAHIELNKTYFELLRHFDFQIVNPTAGMNSRSHGTFFDKRLYVRVTDFTATA